MNKLLLSTLCIFTFATAQAQTALQVQKTGDKLSLQRCVDIALQNNISVKQSVIQLQSATLSFDQSRNNRLPNLNGSISESFNFGRSVDPFTNTAQDKSINFNNLGVNGGVTVFNGQLLKNTILQNDILLKATQFDLQAMKENISLQVALAYLNILSAEDQLSIAKTQSEITKLQIDRTDKLVKAGSLPISNYLDLKAQLANEETVIINNQSTLDIANLTLIQLLNDKNITDVQLDRISVPTPSTNGYEESADKVYQAAENNQAFIKAADLRVRSADKGIDIARAGFLPTVFLSASMGANQSNTQKEYIQSGTTTNNLGTVTFNGQDIPLIVSQPKFADNGTVSYFKQLGNTFNYGFGANVNIPIFSRFLNRTRVSQANLQKYNAELEAQKTRLNLRQNIEQALFIFTYAAKRYDATNVQVQALQESFRASESRFNAGAIDFVAYNLQKTNLDKARANLVQTKYDYVFRTKILDFYQGKPIGF